MASNHGNTNNDTESAKIEQIITEFFAKSLHIILESRSSYMSTRNFSGEHVLSPASSSPLSSSSGIRSRDKWFNLALKECPAALDNIDIWRQSSFDPMVIDVEEVKSEKIVERWIVHHENKRSRDRGGSASRRSGNSLHTLYKKCILLLRSLYLTVRLLPAYKIVGDQNSSGRNRTFSIAHRVSSFVDPKEESEMQRFVFTPVETPCGRLCIKVFYHPSVLDFSSESSTPVSSQFIPDYVGSPLADPVKRFPSVPVSHCSPSSFPLSRPHSWSNDRRFKASPPSFTCSPSMHLQAYQNETSSAHKRNVSFDEYSPSPNFTPSSSASPPIYIPRSHLSAAHLRSGSAPISIASRQNLPPSSPVKCIKYTSPKTDKTAGFVQTGELIEKSMSPGKDDARKYLGMKISSNNSPRISFSRSSSRSFADDFDDFDFPCPFDVDEDDMTDSSSRPESFDQKGDFPIRKSQEAAVGAFVLMLKKAPPLRQDFSSSVDMFQDSIPRLCNTSLREDIKISATPAASSISSSGLAASKTTADGLEELRGYKEIVKDLLLHQAGRSNSSTYGTSLPNSSATN